MTKFYKCWIEKIKGGRPLPVHRASSQGGKASLLLPFLGQRRGYCNWIPRGRERQKKKRAAPFKLLTISKRKGWLKEKERKGRRGDALKTDLSVEGGFVKRQGGGLKARAPKRQKIWPLSDMK